MRESRRNSILASGADLAQNGGLPMQLLTNGSRIELVNGEIRIYCECGVPGALARGSEYGKPVWGYVCSKEGHALTDSADTAELDAFKRHLRARILKQV